MSNLLSPKSIRIGGATGYWGDSDLAVPQFLSDGSLDYIVFDYLAEVTMSILARAKAADPAQGYALDFVSGVVRPHLQAIAKSGVKLISNAGGVNPAACADAIRRLIDDAGVDLSVAVIVGDDLMDSLDSALPAGATEMFSGESRPPLDTIASANAYLGAFPLAEALKSGADIVITGRCVDSAVTLAACIHAFDWQADDLNKLAAGSLVGHLIECGSQVTGGNYTDWVDVADSLAAVGYPIATIDDSGLAEISKPAETGGCVTIGTVGEQLLYEIGDPSAYLLPDVICDFSHVTLVQNGPDRVLVSGARGVGVPEGYKVSVTWADGWRAGVVGFYVGEQAAHKARLYANEVIVRARHKLEALGVQDFDEILVEVVGDESHYGQYSKADSAEGTSSAALASREVAFKLACRHQDKLAVGLLLKEFSGAGLGGPPGFCGFSGTRPKPSPVVRLFSTTLAKHAVNVRIMTDQGILDWQPILALPEVAQHPQQPSLPALEVVAAPDCIAVPLQRLAWVRSGDKGDKANIGVMARQPEYLPWIAASLTRQSVARRFAHFMTSPEIDCFYLPGFAALNFVLHNSLGGGGVASLRNDPQAKCYGQVLLDATVLIPRALLGD